MLCSFPELKWSYSGFSVSSAPIMAASAGVQSSLNIFGLIEGRELTVMGDVAQEIGGVGKADEEL